MLIEDCKNSDGLRSCQNQTVQTVSGRKISETSEVLHFILLRGVVPVPSKCIFSLGVINRKSTVNPRVYCESSKSPLKVLNLNILLIASKKVRR